MHSRAVHGVALAMFCLAAIGASAPIARAGLVEVGVGYADGLRPNVGTPFPTPWRGDAGVHFIGESNPNASFECGVICFNNIGTSDIVLDPGLTVDGFQNGASFQLWDGIIGTGVTIAPGEMAIVAQTVEYDFDTSDQTSGTETNPDNFKPVIHASFDGGTTTASYIDTAQVLNTGGFDLALKIAPATGQGTNESLRCRKIGTTGINDPFGNTVPEPGSLSLLLGGLPVLGLAIRRRK
jgi:hypothetical protein